MRKYLKKIKSKFKISRYIYAVTVIIIFFIGMSFYFYDPFDFFKVMRNKTREKHLGILEDAMKRYKKYHHDDDIFDSMTEYPRCIGTNKSEGKFTWYRTLPNSSEQYHLAANSPVVTVDSNGNSYIVWSSYTSKYEGDETVGYSVEDGMVYNLFLRKIGKNGGIPEQFNVKQLTHFNSKDFGGGARSPIIVYSAYDDTIIIGWLHLNFGGLNGTKYNIFIQKYTLEGEPVWDEAKNIASTSEHYSIGIDKLDQSKLMIIGLKGLKLFFQRIDNNGNLIYSTNVEIDLPTDGWVVDIDNNNNIIVSNPANIMKVSTTTKKVFWVLKAQEDEKIIKFVVDRNNNVITLISGVDKIMNTENIDFEENKRDTYVQKINFQGKKIWRKKIDNGGYISAGYNKIANYGIFINQNDTILLVEHFSLKSDRYAGIIPWITVLTMGKDNFLNAKKILATPIMFNSLNNLAFDRNGDIRIVGRDFSKDGDAISIGRIDIGCYDFASRLVPKYLSQMPVDPVGGGNDITGYNISRSGVYDIIRYFLEANFSEEIDKYKPMLKKWSAFE